jgi:hypothetical protein
MKRRKLGLARKLHEQGEEQRAGGRALVIEPNQQAMISEPADENRPISQVPSSNREETFPFLS